MTLPGRGTLATEEEKGAVAKTGDPRELLQSETMSCEWCGECLWI